MAFLFRPGGPLVGVRAPALTAGVTAWAVPASAVPGVDISIVPDQAPLLPLPEPIAAIAVGNPLSPYARAGGLATATACGRGGAQRDCGRLSP
jgi:hypothetical protein